MKRVKNRILFYKALLVEVIETLCSICLFLEMEGRLGRNPRAEYMGSHFRTLKEASSVLKKELAEREKNE